MSEGGEKTKQSKNAELIIKDLHVSVEGNEILKGISLEIKQGEVIALMGPNGSGKSTLAYAIMGHPKYEITKGEIKFNGENLLEMSPDKRARAGLFLSFQYPSEISGVTVTSFLRTALAAKKGEKPDILEFQELLDDKFDLLKIDSAFASRYLNEGFSGGEKKRMEILQMAVLEPKIAILDETDSGLDIDALKTVAEGVNTLVNNNMGALIITHYQRILNYIKPDRVIIFSDGKVIKEGGAELVAELEEHGYDHLTQ